MQPQPNIEQRHLKSAKHQIMYVKPKACQALTLGLRGWESPHQHQPLVPLAAAVRVRKIIKLFIRPQPQLVNALGAGFGGIATGFVPKRASLTGHTHDLGFHCLPHRFLSFLVTN